MAVELLVCTSCRVMGQDPTDGIRPGQTLVEALPALLPDGVTLRPTECLSNCSRGCSIALRKPGAYTYVYGDIDPAQPLDDIIEGIAKYRDTPDGRVPWRERPEHFRKHCIARIPPLEA